MDSRAHIWEEEINIPTYPVYPPEKGPLFIEKRAYQGSTGKVYPFPVTEKISDEKQDRVYKAVFLENEYLKVMILPQLGGRIQRAYDKTNGYDFVYYNQVIKPALVGLAGPWISGGIEFNWPQHHRPSTYSPVDYSLQENPDGSVSVYVGEIDKMYGTKGMARITLYPGKAYIEIKGQLYNPTDMPQTFLWWANPAVPVNDHTYSVFPPDVNAVMDHGKRAVSTFPIATGEYYKCDYSAGVDISRYKNVKVPTSFMAAHSDYDFIGNYDEKVGAGLLHVADHHVSPGKKQWTWGNGDFGRMWDRNLTDEDGPYIELMTGVFTDNQPDFSWLKPHEEKVFTQYFMPYKGVGRVGNATKDAMVSMTLEEDHALLKVYTTACYPDGRILVTCKGDTLLDQLQAFEAGMCNEITISGVSETMEKDMVITVLAGAKQLVRFQKYDAKLEPIPQPAEPMAAPGDMRSTEDLYLAAMHLEQYRHATYEPADYYKEGLRRDPGDIRLNNGYGLLLLRRGYSKESILHFKTAIRKQTWKNPNPYSGECYFNLGLAYEAEDQDDLAYDAFYKATWSSETQSSAFYHLGCLAAKKGDYELAVEFVDRSMLRSWHNMKARTLKTALWRKLYMDTSDILAESSRIDPLCMGIAYERAMSGSGYDFSQWTTLMRTDSHNYLILAWDYMEAGLYEDAVRILEMCPSAYPMVKYYLAYAYIRMGRDDDAVKAICIAEQMSPDYCFPNKLEEMRILESCIRIADAAPMAEYYLGNLLYDKKQYDRAAACWLSAVSKKEDLAMAYRNLSIYYYNKHTDTEKAMEMMEKACHYDASYPRFWLEYDQLCAKVKVSCEHRLATMESHMDMTMMRDDLCLRYISMLNCLGRHQEALDTIMGRQFHPWEGGEGKVIVQYRYALTQLAIEKLGDSELLQALELLKRTLEYPTNLGEGKLPNVRDNRAHYYMGLVYRKLGDETKAEEYLTLATEGSSIPSSVLYYNDQPSDYIFYQGLAYRALGKEAAARKSFHQLIIYGEQHLFDQVAYDFFAVSLPEIEVFQDDIVLRNEQYCNYLRALGAIGLGEQKKASGLLQEIIRKQPDDIGALMHLGLLK